MSEEVEQGLKIVEKQVAGLMHVNLRVLPESRLSSVLECMPGEGNLWSLLAFAFFAYKVRL